MLDGFKQLWALKRVRDAAQKVNWGELMGHNWKAYTGAGLIAAATALEYLGCDGCAKLAEALMGLGQALGFVGIRHAVRSSL